MSMTLEEMYKDLLEKNLVMRRERPSRDGRTDQWPWAVDSLHTTPIPVESEEAPQSDASVE